MPFPFAKLLKKQSNATSIALQNLTAAASESVSATVEICAPTGVESAVALMTYGGPHAKIMKRVCILGRALHAGSGNANIKFEAQSLVTLVLGGYGGGILVPLILGRPPAPLVVDDILIAAFISFVLFSTTNFGLLYRWSIFKCVGLCLEAMFRVNLIAGLTTAALNALPSAIGPIILGSIAGIGGLFLPLSKGIDALKAPLKGAITRSMLTALIIAITTQPQRYGLNESIFKPMELPMVTAVLILLTASYDLGAYFSTSKPSPTKPIVSAEKQSTKGNLFTFLFSLFGLVAGAAAFFYFEDSLEPVDALYLAASTFSTIGFGDLVPLTIPGRTVAMMLMLLSGATYTRAAAIAYNKAKVSPSSSAVLSAITICVAFGSIIASLEHWSLFSTIYFVVSLGSTTGFGDLVVSTDESKYLLTFFSLLVPPAIADIGANVVAIVESLFHDSSSSSANEELKAKKIK